MHLYWSFVWLWQESAIFMCYSDISFRRLYWTELYSASQGLQLFSIMQSPATAFYTAYSQIRLEDLPESDKQLTCYRDQSLQ